MQAGIADGELGGDFTFTPYAPPSGIRPFAGPDPAKDRAGVSTNPEIGKTCTDELTREPKAGTTKVVKRIDRERVQVKIEIIRV